MTPDPAPGLAHDPNARGLLSSVIDGDGDADSTERLCRQWRDDPALRSTWHEYHLIGDVLRSPDLRADPDRDAAFLNRLRERLTQEPAIVAPQAMASPSAPTASAGVARERRLRWMAPAAMAAGFVAVAGVLVVAQTSSVEQAAPALASQGVTLPSSVAVRVAAPVPETSAAPDPTDVKLIRDARIDSYLQAHRDMRLSPAAASPGGALRNVDVMLAPR